MPASTPAGPEGWMKTADDIARTLEAHPKLGFAAMAAATVAAAATFGVSEVLLGLGAGYVGVRALRRRRARKERAARRDAELAA